MGKSRRQKGAGFFNFFTRRRAKVEPVAPGRTYNVKNESYEDALRRNYVFFHYKLQGQEPPRSQRTVTPAQEAEVRRVLLEASGRNMSADEIVTSIFHSDPIRFQEEFGNWEEYNPDKFLNKGTPYQRRAFPVARSLERFIATIRRTPESVKYVSNVQQHACEHMDVSEPVRALTDDYCFTLLSSENCDMFEEGKGHMYPVSYIVVKPEFYPKASASLTPITLSAKRIPAMRFLLDAFRQKGVVEIEPTFKATLEREAPELMAFGEQDPVVILSPSYLYDPSTTRDRFLLVEPTFFSRGRNVVNWKVFAKSSTVQDAFVKRRVLGMDAKTLAQVRTQLPQLWIANFGQVNQRVFSQLSTHEKIAFCVILFVRYFETYALLRDSRPANSKSEAQRKALNAAKQAKTIVFQTDYDKGANPFDLAESFQAGDTANFRQLIELQKELLGSAEIQTPEDVRRLLAKFDMRPESRPSPVIQNYFGPSTAVNLGPNLSLLTKRNRRQRVKQMTLTANLQKERGELVEKIKTALRTPAKSSLLPNFLRTRKAKNMNRQQFIQRIEKAKQNLLNFNRAHGLPTPSNSYGYKF
jgi:hypothetical protein